MSITRKALKGMQLTDEQVDSIIEMHTETVNSLKNTIEDLKDSAENLKNDIEKYKADSEKLPDVEKEIEKLKKEVAKENPFEKKYNDLKKEYDNYKTDTETKERKTAVNNAVKSYFESKNIKGGNLDIALRAAQGEISAVELEDGKIKDTAALDELIGGTLSGLVSTTEIQGATVATPPSNAGGKAALTKDDIMKIKNTAERQQAIAENPDLFGI